MKRIIVAIALTVTAVLGVSAPAAADIPDAPVIGKPIVDEANILSDQDEYTISALMNLIRSETGHELAVLTVQSLNGETIEAFSLEVANTWGVGQEKQNDGVLLVIAMDERELRLEVGTGLEAEIPDATAKDIVDNVISPPLSQGDYVGGIVAGFKSLESIFLGETPATPIQTAPVSSGPAFEWNAGIFWSWTGGIVGAIVLIIAGVFGINKYLDRKAEEKREREEEERREAIRKARIEREKFLKTPAGKAEIAAAEARAKRQAALRKAEQEAEAKRRKKLAKEQAEAKKFYDNLPESVKKEMKAASSKSRRQALLDTQIKDARRRGDLSGYSTPDNNLMNTILLFSIFSATTSHNYGYSGSGSDSSSSSRSSSYDSSPSSYSSSFDSGSFGGGGFDGGGGSGGF